MREGGKSNIKHFQYFVYLYFEQKLNFALYFIQEINEFTDFSKYKRFFLFS
jgi:hypothetical protein